MEHKAVTIDLEFLYDHRGRVTKAYHTINNGTKVLLAAKKYNELGQLIEENLHSTDGKNFPAITGLCLQYSGLAVENESA
jgi:hypothetical protein